MSDKDRILREFSKFSLGTGGIGNWLSEETDEGVFQRLARVSEDHLSHAQFNQLLVLGKEAPVSEGFFQYYFLSAIHVPYDVTKLPDFSEDWIRSDRILALSQLRWGLCRIFTDGLLYFGSVRTAFRELRNLSREDINEFFLTRSSDVTSLASRGPALPLESIPRDDRYLISEMACKSFGDSPLEKSELREALRAGYNAHLNGVGGPVSIRSILQGSTVSADYKTSQPQLLLSADDALDTTIESHEDLDRRFELMADKFLSARSHAVANTRLYLSMASDLDVYVATSMRTRDDFRRMADVCDELFSAPGLRELNVRYFDPTLSAAQGHEDKGLIECLMVKAAKLLVYYAGDRDSYGKDAEAAMALSLGKPVIFLCDTEQRKTFYRDVHPLSRLIQFSTGVAVGAMATDKIADASELVRRILMNQMEYDLEHNQDRRGYLRLRDKLTSSIIRLQTNDMLLNEAFWNLYHEAPQGA